MGGQIPGAKTSFCALDHRNRPALWLCIATPRASSSDTTVFLSSASGVSSPGHRPGMGEPTRTCVQRSAGDSAATFASTPHGAVLRTAGRFNDFIAGKVKGAR